MNTPIPATAERPLARRYDQSLLLLVPIILLAAILQFAALGAKSLWVDEWWTLQDIRASNLPALFTNILNIERRPPLYFVLLWAISLITGPDEVALRVPSALAAVTCVPVLYMLARRMIDGPNGAQLGLMAALCLAISSMFVLYGRIMRAYAPYAFLALLSCWLLLEALHRQRSRAAWIAYVAVTIILLYTDYIALPVLAGQAVFVLITCWRRSASQSASQRGSLVKWIVAAAVMAISYVPWSLFILAQIMPKAGHVADLSDSPLGLVLRLAYPFYGFAVGETLFPWNPLAILGIVVIAVLCVIGCFRLWRTAPSAFLFPALLLAATVVGVATLLSFVARDMGFTTSGSRALAAAPFFYLFLAAGLLALRRWLLRAGLVALLLVVWGAGILNYWQGREFHNPIFSVPTRELVADAVAQARPTDLFVTDFDTLFPYYYQKTGFPAPLLDQSPADRVETYVEQNHTQRVWLVYLGRDSTRENTPTALMDWLGQHYQVAGQWGYAESDPTYMLVKERLLKQPTYRYKTNVILYERTDNAAAPINSAP